MKFDSNGMETVCSILNDAIDCLEETKNIDYSSGIPSDFDAQEIREIKGQIQNIINGTIGLITTVKNVISSIQKAEADNTVIAKAFGTFSGNVAKSAKSVIKNTKKEISKFAGKSKQAQISNSVNTSSSIGTTSQATYTSGNSSQATINKQTKNKKQTSKKESMKEKIERISSDLKKQKEPTKLDTKSKEIEKLIDKHVNITTSEELKKFENELNSITKPLGVESKITIINEKNQAKLTDKEIETIQKDVNKELKGGNQVYLVLHGKKEETISFYNKKGEAVVTLKDEDKAIRILEVADEGFICMSGEEVIYVKYSEIQKNGNIQTYSIEYKEKVNVKDTTKKEEIKLETEKTKEIILGEELKLETEFIKETIDEEEIQLEPEIIKETIDEEEIQLEPEIIKETIDEEEIQLEPEIIKETIDEEEIELEPEIVKETIKEEEIPLEPERVYEKEKPLKPENVNE